MRDENNIPSLRFQSCDIAQYPEIANQSNRPILGGSRVAYANSIYKPYSCAIHNSNRAIELNGCQNTCIEKSMYFLLLFFVSNVCGCMELHRGSGSF